MLPLALGSRAKEPPAESPCAAGARLEAMQFSLCLCKHAVSTAFNMLFLWGKKVPLVLHRAFEPAVHQDGV